MYMMQGSKSYLKTKLVRSIFGMLKRGYILRG